MPIFGFSHKMIAWNKKQLSNLFSALLALRFLMILKLVKMAAVVVSYIADLVLIIYSFFLLT